VSRPEALRAAPFAQATDLLRPNDKPRYGAGS